MKKNIRLFYFSITFTKSIYSLYNIFFGEKTSIFYSIYRNPIPLNIKTKTYPIIYIAEIISKILLKLFG
jgi:hypothetical protein